MKRKDAITAAAIAEADAIISEYNGVVKATSVKIDRICRAYVLQRTEVLKPTAAAIASELGRPVRTIYNNPRYGRIIHIWLKAYDDLLDVRAGSLRSPEDKSNLLICRTWISVAGTRFSF